ncbi:MAG: hypothetical protein CSA58_08805 [Micrococcales bacterium]|nr:MAG: hypothetical protein CSB46_03050 [Micrococcales bacterium]PIE26583.1 MAG: hypothetical protein CSA58_08805 [Micrococcales bacterium]
MARSLLSAALIVKNESAMLAGCLDSLNALRPLLSDVVVYDTGSTDGTQDIAAAHGARVHQGSWTGDFAAARNAAIGLTRSRWVLIIDADERVSADVAQLRALLRRANETAEGMTVQMSLINDAGARESTFPSVRLLDPRKAKYVGAVHEQVAPRRGKRGLRAIHTDASVISVDHVGYRAAHMPAKLARNAALADAEITKGLAAGRDLGELIQPLVDRARSLAPSDPEAAIADYEQLAAMADATSGYRLWGLEKYTELLIELGRHERAAEIIELLASAEQASDTATAWLRVQLLLATGRFERALDLLRTLNAVESTTTRMTVNNANLTFARLRAAINVGEHEEALACCLSLIVDHGRSAGLAPELIALWHDRPVQPLVQILQSAQHRTVLELATQLQGVREPGPTVAQQLAGQAA